MNRSTANDEEDENLDTQAPPLRVRCTDSDCEEDLHCFLKKRGMKTEPGTCRKCGANLIDWGRVHQRDRSDVRFTFDAMRLEKIRHHMWHVRFDPVALGHAKKLGLDQLLEKVLPRLRTSVGKPKGAWDGRQTPMEGNTIFYAQHATATCCRKCLSYWHGIPDNVTLTAEQLQYCEHLVKEYLDQRLEGQIPRDPNPAALNLRKKPERR